VSIAENLAAVRARLDAACRAAGRDPSAVTLVAVSKTFPSSAIREAYAAGQRDFGENYAQELRDKAKELADLSDIRWHYVGRLQTNKAKYVAPVAFRAHAIESAHEAEALSARAPGELGVLVAVNVGGEETKGGVPPEVALDVAASIAKVPRIAVRGLMCIPPPRENPEDVAPFFEKLADLAAQGRARGLDLVELSMGMSHDFEVAVKHGATHVRVGTAIFGGRT
jgi:pyridoxal phosphate enzyme (YggS family)